MCVEAAAGDPGRVYPDGELHPHSSDLELDIDTQLYGPRMYEQKVSYWPSADEKLSAPTYEIDYAHPRTAVPTVVFSRSQGQVEWNARLVREDARAEVERLKRQDGLRAAGSEDPASYNRDSTLRIWYHTAQMFTRACIGLAFALALSACGIARLTRIPLAPPLPTEEPLQASPSPIRLGATTPKPADAREALLAFFAAISSGDYVTAGSMYGYGVNETQELAQIVSEWRDGDPAWSVDPTDYAAVLEKVCTGGFLCLPLRAIVSEIRIGPAETEFIVELSGPDGELFVLGPCCGATATEMPPRSQFTYIVTRDETGTYRVKWAPILEP